MIALLLASLLTTTPEDLPMSSKLTLFEPQLRSYFRGEVQESWVFVGLGAAAVVGGAIMFTRNNDFLRGAAFPLIGVALIQLVVGVAVLWRSNQQVSDLLGLANSDPSAFMTQESKRMAVVNRNFTIYKSAEIVLMILGAGVAAAGYVKKTDLAFGIGLGLVAQSAVMFTFDLIAERRAEVYVAHITGLGR